MLHHSLARLEELVLGREELVVDAMAVALLAPPLVGPDLPAVRQALVTCTERDIYIYIVSEEQGENWVYVECRCGFDSIRGLKRQQQRHCHVQLKTTCKREFLNKYFLTFCSILYTVYTIQYTVLFSVVCITNVSCSI